MTTQENEPAAEAKKHPEDSIIQQAQEVTGILVGAELDGSAKGSTVSVVQQVDAVSGIVIGARLETARESPADAPVTPETSQAPEKPRGWLARLFGGRRREKQ
jgi:hypothetical protein